MSFHLLSATDRSDIPISFDRHHLIHSSLDPMIRTAKRRDERFNIGTRSSYERSERVGDREGRDYYQFKLNRSARVRITANNREFLFGPSLKIRLEKRGSSGRINRTAFPLGTALIDRRFSSGTYTLRVSSEGESVPYRLTYRRRSDNDFDFFN